MLTPPPDPSKPWCLQDWISGALTQKHPDGSIRPVAYASRSLSPVEQRYSQTEREALSGAWACEKFHFYIHGSQFDLVGDHKPLEVVLNAVGTHHRESNVGDQNYSPRIVYQRGIKTAVDFLSRKPVTTNTIHLEILLRTTLTPLWLTPFLLPSLFRSFFWLPNMTLLWKPSRSAWTLGTGRFAEQSYCNSIRTAPTHSSASTWGEPRHH